MQKSDLPPTDFDHLEETIRQRVIIEVFHNMGLIPDKVYYIKYSVNAEALDRDFRIWKELEDIK
jgi:hypothetical protein